MGAFCCCPCGEDFEEYIIPNSSIYRHCICLRYFFHQLFSWYMFERLEGRAVTSLVQGATPLSSTTISNPSVESSFSETHQLVPRPAPYDTDPRKFQVWVHFVAALVERTSKNMSIQTVQYIGTAYVSDTSFISCLVGVGFTSERLEGRAVTSLVQGETPLSSTTISNPSVESSFSETHQLVPRPAPYDTDPRYSRLVSRREKSSSHIQEDSQLLNRSSTSKKNSTDPEEECKVCRSESEKLISAKGAYGMDYVMTTLEDEDVCPTCLDEYAPENPKIITKCSHHFHLGCLYEWMERSDFCPLCGKEMEISESP